MIQNFKWSAAWGCHYKCLIQCPNFCSMTRRVVLVKCLVMAFKSDHIPLGLTYPLKKQGLYFI